MFVCYLELSPGYLCLLGRQNCAGNLPRYQHTERLIVPNTARTLWLVVRFGTITKVTLAFHFVFIGDGSELRKSVALKLGPQT